MNITELHNRALELAERAFILKRVGDSIEAIELFAKAYEYELAAAELAKQASVGEPTISILYRSAASLAYNSNKWNEAEKIIFRALLNNPPIEIEEELRILLNEIDFQRHLSLKGIQIEDDEFQLVLEGNGVAHGMARANIVNDKLNTIESLAFRTAERRQGKPFRKTGSTDSSIKSSFQSYISVPRAASFAFSIKIGTPTNQLPLDMEVEGSNNPADILDDLFENLDLVNKGSYEELRESIKDEDYFQNFVGLSKALAPDGEEIRLVGLTIIRKDKQKDIQFTRVKKDFSPHIIKKPENPEVVETQTEITGRLFEANEKKDSIQLYDNKKITYTILVPNGLNDIVKKYWGEDVIIQGTVAAGKRKINLIDIEPL